MVLNKPSRSSRTDVRCEPRLISEGISFTQERLKKMSELNAPEYVNREGVLYYCPYTTMFNIWHKIGENPNFPEWNYIETYSLKYIVHTGNYKPTKEEIVSCDDLLKYLKENDYHGRVRFENDNLMYMYKDSKCRTLKLW